MSQQNKTTLQANINTDLADNTTGDISASDIRGNLINITDSLLFNSGSQTFDGTLNVNGTISGSFEGNGSNLTGVTAEWDGTLDGTAAITGSLIVASGSRGIFKNLNDAIYLGTFDNATDGQYPGFIIKSDLSALGSQIVGYKFGEYQPLYLNTDGSSRAKTFIGYSSTQTNDDINAQLNLKNANASYALDVVDGASFRNATTRFENSNLNLVQSYITLDSSSAYPFRPANDNAGEGLAVGRYNDQFDQQLIISYQGGAGRVIAKELNIDAPQIRLELQDSSTTEIAAQFTKTQATIFKSLDVTGSLQATGGITGSLLGTGSYALNALTASYALSSAGGGGSTDTGSLLTTASVSLNTITFTKGDASTFDITVDTGSAGGGGSTFPYTGSAEISGSLTVEGPTVLTGSLEVSGSVTIGRLDGAGLDLGVYSINTASFQIDYLDMAVYSDTTIDAYSFGSTVSNFEIKNTAQYGGTKGYIKLNAGDLLITGSAVYIKPSSLPTSEPSDSGQLWLSGSAGNSKYLMVRD